MPRVPEGTRLQRPKKAPGTAADKRNGQKIVSVANLPRFPYFEPPETVKTPAALQAWEGFWEDRQPHLITPSSKHILIRWIEAVDRYAWATTQADGDPIQEGSTGQPIVNALYKVAADALHTVEKCEKILGIGPLNATGLGLAVIQEHQGLNDINKGVTEADDDDEDEEDPRQSA
jgi:hypothetical protein